MTRCRMAALSGSVLTLMFLVATGVAAQVQSVGEPAEATTGAAPNSLTSTSDSAPGPALLPAPGTYPEAVTLVAPEAGYTYRFLDPMGRGHTEHRLPLGAGLLLDAPRGTEIAYTLEVTDPAGESSTVLTYAIDRVGPQLRSLSPVEGLYDEPVTVTLVADDENASFFATVRRPGGGHGASLVTAASIELSGESGDVVDYEVTAWAIDAVGNTGDAVVGRYRVDRRAEGRARTAPILSPVDGAFGNLQRIVVDPIGLSHPELTLTGSDGEARIVSLPSHGHLFLGPLVDGAGEYSLTLVDRDALGPGQDATVQTVRWTQQERDPPFSVPEAIVETVDLPLTDPPHRISRSDRAVSVRDPLQLRPVRLQPQPGSVALEVIRSLDPDGVEYRMAILLDGRVAPSPAVTASSFGDEVVIYSLADTLVEVAIGPRGFEPEEGDFAAAVDIARITNLAEAGEPVDVVARSRWTSSRPGAAVRFEYTPPSAVDLPTGTDLAGSARVDLNDVAASFGETSLMAGGEVIVRIVRSGASGDQPRIWNVPPGYRVELTRAVDGAEVGGVANLPPAPPTIGVSDRQLSLTGADGTLQYRINGGAATEWSEPIPLFGRDGTRIVYDIEAWELVDGQRSPSATSRFVVDRRTPAVPPLLTPAVPVLVNEESVDLVFEQPYDDLTLTYRVRGEEREEVGEARDLIRVTGPPEGTDETLTVDVYARFDGRDDRSAQRTIPIRFDRAPPPAPLFTGSTASEGNNGLVAFRTPSDPEASIFFRLQPEDSYRLYVAPIAVAEAARVEAFSIDAAGNRTELAQPIDIAAPGRPPAPPRIALDGVETDGALVVLQSLAQIDVRGEDASSVRARLYRSGSQEIPAYGTAADLGAPPAPQDGSEESWILETFAERTPGGSSSVRRLLITLDRRRPTPPPQPVVVRSTDGGSARLIWPGIADGRLELAARGEEFRIVGGRETIVDLPTGGVALAIRAVDEAGNISDTTDVVISPQLAVAPPRYIGAEDGMRYGASRTVSIEADGVVRYAVATDGRAPAPVHSQSPVYDAPLRFEAPSGTELPVHIRARAESADGSLSDAVDIRFAVDREPPQTPDLVGVAAGAFYESSQRVTFDAEAGVSVWVRIADEAAGRSAEFARWDGNPLTLEATEGGLRVYRVEAYAVDDAGNRSLEVAEWQVTIDRAIVYADGGASGGSGDGSRGRPDSTILRALQRMVAEGRSTLFLTEGVYRLERREVDLISEIAARRPVSIVGGFAAGTWRAGSAPSLIGGAPLRLGGEVQLRGVYLDAPMTVVSGARVRIENVTVAGADASSGADAAMDVDAPNGADARNDGPVAIEIESGAALEATRTVVDGRVRLGVGATLTATSLDASHLTVAGGSADLSLSLLTGVTVGDGGDARLVSTAIGSGANTSPVVVEEGSLRLSESTVIAGGATAVGISVAGGEVSIERSVVSVTGGNAVGVLVRNGTAAIRDSVVEALGDALAYAVSGRASRVGVVNSLIRTVGGGETSPLIVDGGSLEVVHSIVGALAIPLETSERAQGPTSLIRGIQMIGGRATVVNSILATVGEPSAPAATRGDTRQRPAPTGALLPHAATSGGGPSLAIRRSSGATISTAGLLVAGWGQIDGEGRVAGATVIVPDDALGGSRPLIDGANRAGSAGEAVAAIITAEAARWPAVVGADLVGSGSALDASVDARGAIRESTPMIGPVER